MTFNITNIIKKFLNRSFKGFQVHLGVFLTGEKPFFDLLRKVVGVWLSSKSPVNANHTHADTPFELLPANNIAK